MTHSTITGIGTSLPERVVGNDFFSEYLDTSEEWISSRTGIKTRRFVEPGTQVAELALPAAQGAMEMAGMKATDVDLILFATTTPDRFMPSTACLLQGMLGSDGCPALDVQAVCSGFLYGLELADALVRSEKYERILLVGAEIYSRVLDFDDRSTCILFGDGAGAAVIAASDKPGIAAVNLGADGSLADVITMKGHVAKNEIVGDGFFRMDGPKVYKLAISAMERSARKACEEAGIEVSDIDWLVPHQANLRILDTLASRMGVDQEKVVRTVTDHANTSAASVPLALESIWERIKPGEWVMLSAVGGGLTWGSALWRA